MRKSRFFGVLCSFIPGAAHMYLGLKRQGLQLMCLFFLPIVISDFLGISLVFFALPIVWFYSFFDALRKLNGEEPLEDHDILPVKWFADKDFSIAQNKVIAYGLIVIGGIMILNRIALPMVSQFLPYYIRNYIQTGIVAVLFIIGGIKLLAGGKMEKGADQE